MQNDPEGSPSITTGSFGRTTLQPSPLSRHADVEAPSNCSGHNPRFLAARHSEQKRRYFYLLDELSASPRSIVWKLLAADVEGLLIFHTVLLLDQPFP